MPEAHETDHEVLDIQKLNGHWPVTPVAKRRELPDEVLKVVYKTESESVAGLLRRHLELRGVQVYLDPLRTLVGGTPVTRIVVRVWSRDAHFAGEIIKIFRAHSPARPV